MIELTNTEGQTILPGQSVNFDKVLLRTGCGECYNRQLPNSIKLKGGCNSVYELHFNGNITASAAATPIELSMAIGTTALVETEMNATPVAAGDLVNVSTSTLFRVCCSDLNRDSIINSGTNPVTLAPNSNFYVVRKS